MKSAKDVTSAPNGASAPLPTKQGNTAPAKELYNRTSGAPAGPPKNNLVDTNPRQPAAPLVTEKPDLHNR